MDLAILLTLTLLLLGKGNSHFGCLTWDIEKYNLQLVCRTNNFTQPVAFIDTKGVTQANCTFDKGLPVCTSYNNFGSIIADTDQNAVTFKLSQFDTSYVNGKWTCLQGDKKYKTLVSTRMGIIAATKLSISGEIQTSKDKINVKCFSCRLPDRNFVEFMVNNKTVDTLYYDAKTKLCRSSYGECTSPKMTCFCLSSGTEFIRTFPVSKNKTNIAYSCEMRYTDKAKLSRFAKYATMMEVNGEITVLNTTTVTTRGPDNEMDEYENVSDVPTDHVDSTKPVEIDTGTRNKTEYSIWIIISVVSLLLVVIAGVLIIKSQKSCINKRRNIRTPKTNADEDAMRLLGVSGGTSKKNKRISVDKMYIINRCCSVEIIDGGTSIKDETPFKENYGSMLRTDSVTEVVTQVVLETTRTQSMVNSETSTADLLIQSYHSLPMVHKGTSTEDFVNEKLDTVPMVNKETSTEDLLITKQVERIDRNTLHEEQTNSAYDEKTISEELKAPTSAAVGEVTRHMKDFEGKISLEERQSQMAVTDSDCISCSYQNTILLKDFGPCIISSMAVSRNGSLYLCDCYTSRLLVCEKNGSNPQSIEIHYIPWDIAMMPNENKAVLTCINKNYVQFVNIDNHKPIKDIHIDGISEGGIFCTDENILVGGYKKIHFLDLGGTQLRVLENICEVNAKIRFISHHERRIVYNAYGSSAVRCVDFDGSEEFRYNSPTLDTPMKILSDQYGNHFVVGRKSNNIVILDRKGQFKGIPLSVDDRLEGPRSICIDKNHSELFLSNKTGQGHCVLVFKVRHKRVTGENVDVKDTFEEITKLSDKVVVVNDITQNCL